MRQPLPARVSRAALPLALCLLLLVASGGQAEQPAERGGPQHAGGAPTDNALLQMESYELGKRVFFEETFEGNGRTCATCHVTQDDFSITPERIEATFQEDPDHPLFRPVDSDDGDGVSYDVLRQTALFNVDIELHPDVRLVDHPLQRVIFVRRAVPSILNVALTAPYLLDGREPDLATQAGGAVATHMKPGREPKAKELDAVARFQREFFSPDRLRFELDPEPPEEPGYSLPLLSTAARRGQNEFNLHCFSCHSGELLHRPGDPNLSEFSTVFVSELNRPALPRLVLAFKNEDGSETIVQTPDPGRAAITGKLVDLNTFEVNSLRGIKHTAPYFHDNSADDLREVVEHYNLTFGFGIAGRRLEDLLVFLEIL